MWPWRVKMPTQNLLRLLLLLMLMRIVLATIFCRFGRWGLVIKLIFLFRPIALFQDFEAEIWSVFCCWCLIRISSDRKCSVGIKLAGHNFKFSWENFSMQIRKFSQILLKHLSCGWPIFTNTFSILLTTRVLPHCPDLEQEWSGPNCSWDPFYTYIRNPECVIEELFKKSTTPTQAL